MKWHMIRIVGITLSLVCVPLQSGVRYKVFDCIEYAHKVLCHSPILHTLFTPYSRKKDRAKRILLGLIYAETSSIKASLYRLTDADVAQALVDAHLRGVKVEVIIDSGGMRDRYGQTALLAEHGVPLWRYKKHFSILHNKYVVFENTLDNKRLVWTGSANLTHGGLLRNIENIIVVEDDRIVDTYVKDFNRWKEELSGDYMYKNDLDEDA